ncbi:hypothetical protein D9758_003680 [Tetrapyrgos nigripes]|uniref:Uncharacterized protein n=1 Tax=Tetrapyrgos nigripes TaxID=182062 RepID=A0A8H5GLV7_9AGAR|nr:hypothetical protein D9758_003680 [Tetrapyrgos nigripes]
MAYSQQPPSSGFRVPLMTGSAFPHNQAGNPPFQDLDGSPVFIGSALFDKSVHPCKIAPNLGSVCLVAYGGGERAHDGRYDLLPFDPNTMEWVPASHGRIPDGRRPVEGGYEENGERLYHGESQECWSMRPHNNTTFEAVGVVSGIKVPGKTGAHLGGANVSFGGGEHACQNYEILCWKF